MTRPIDHVVTRRSETVLILGEFDGVHRGHRALVDAALEYAKPLRAQVVAVVADRGEGIPRITSVGRRCELLLSLGVSSVFALPLSGPADVPSALGPSLERLRPVIALVDRESWPLQPRTVLSEYVTSIGTVLRDGDAVRDQSLGPINTATVIDRLRGGDVGVAGDMLGRSFELVGATISPGSTSRSTGYQTEMVVSAADAVVPPPGVYAAHTMIGRRWVGAALIIRPRVVVAHLINFAGPLPDAETSFRIVGRLRNEPAQLTRSDVAAVMHVLEAMG